MTEVRHILRQESEASMQMQIHPWSMYLSQKTSTVCKNPVISSMEIEKGKKEMKMKYEFIASALDVILNVMFGIIHPTLRQQNNHPFDALAQTMWLLDRHITFH
jgi:hypothetical protein